MKSKGLSSYVGCIGLDASESWLVSMHLTEFFSKVLTTIIHGGYEEYCAPGIAIYSYFYSLRTNMFTLFH